MANWNEISTTCTLSLIILVLSPSHCSATVFGTKRHERSSGLPPPHHLSTFPPLPLPPSSLNHFLAPPYYTDTPKYPSYSPDYDSEYYYPPEPAYNYPLPPYYGASPNDNRKYLFYQSLMPYYYDARRPVYEYPPLDDVHDEYQADERGEIVDALPMNQEAWFENGGVQQPQPEETMADVNAAFLRNLILSQMYENAQNRESAALRRQHLGLEEYLPQNVDNAGAYYDDNAGYYSQDYEDDDVKELKSLVKKTNEEKNRMLYKVPREEQVWYGNAKSVTGSDSWYKENKKRTSMDYGRIFVNPLQKRDWIKEEVTEAATDTVPTTEAPDFDSRRGQKEVPMLRPALPARRMSAMVGVDDAPVPRNPTVYDSIKQLLNMDKALRKDDETDRAQPHKRFVSNEESLVDQLGGLKKSAA